MHTNTRTFIMITKFALKWLKITIMMGTFSDSSCCFVETIFFKVVLMLIWIVLTLYYILNWVVVLFKRWHGYKNSSGNICLKKQFEYSEQAAKLCVKFLDSSLTRRLTLTWSLFHKCRLMTFSLFEGPG